MTLRLSHTPGHRAPQPPAVPSPVCRRAREEAPGGRAVPRPQRRPLLQTAHLTPPRNPQEAPGCERRDPDSQRSRGALSGGGKGGQVRREGSPTGDGVEAPGQVTPAPSQSAWYQFPSLHPVCWAPLRPPKGRCRLAGDPIPDLAAELRLLFGFLPSQAGGAGGGAHRLSRGLLGARVPERRSPACVPRPHPRRPHPETSCSLSTGNGAPVPKLPCVLLPREVWGARSLIRPLGRWLTHLPECLSVWPGGHPESRDSESRGDVGGWASGFRKAGDSGSDTAPTPQGLSSGLAATPTGAHGRDLNPALLGGRPPRFSPLSPSQPACPVSLSPSVSKAGGDT